MEEGRGPREVASFREQRLTVAAALYCIVIYGGGSTVFQVAIPYYIEPLEAEAYALLLGAKLAAALNSQVVNFLTELAIGPCDPSLLNWQQSLKECNIQSSRLEGKQIKLLISSQSRLGKQVLQALVCIPV
jgi:hypothetical protein